MASRLKKLAEPAEVFVCMYVQVIACLDRLGMLPVVGGGGSANVDITITKPCNSTPTKERGIEREWEREREEERERERELNIYKIYEERFTCKRDSRVIFYPL